jgi:hypothetical protein
MSGYLTNSYSNFAPINPIPLYKRDMPSNFNKIIPNVSMNGLDTIKNKDYKNNNAENYYQMYQQPKNENYDRARYATKSLFEKNEITKIFFSDENMKRIQRQIKSEIYKRTNGQYSLDEDQDESDLTIAMRAIYLDKAKNLPGQTIRQVKILNQQTIDYIVPDMITNIKQYFGYIKDINQPLQPMMRPMNVNNAGRQLLPSITTIWR